MANTLVTYLTWDFPNYNFNLSCLFCHIGAITGVCLKPTDDLNDTKGLETPDDLNDTKGQCEIEGWCPAEQDNFEM